MRAISSSVEHAVGAVPMRPSLRASMNSTLPRRSRNWPFVLVARDEPQAHGDLCRVEQLTRQRDHAVHEVGLDELLADLALAGLLGRHRAVGEHEAGHARRREVVDDVLDPGEVGVARRRHAVLPAHVSRSRSPPQSLTLNGGLARMKSA